MLPFRRNYTTKTCFLGFRLFALFCLFGAFSESLVDARDIFVDDDATEGGDGASWGSAHRYLRTALDEAYSSLDQDGFQNITIKVAEGVYKPTAGATVEELTEPRTISFRLRGLSNSLDRLIIQGGWRGDETSDEPQGDVNATLLSGEIDANKSRWSMHVLFAMPDVSWALTQNGQFRAGILLKGFVITKGNANGFMDSHRKGGGMHNLGSPMIENCIFRDNRALYQGAGMVNNSPTFFIGSELRIWMSSPFLLNCRFENNRIDFSVGQELEELLGRNARPDENTCF